MWQPLRGDGLHGDEHPLMCSRDGSPRPRPPRGGVLWFTPATWDDTTGEFRGGHRPGKANGNTTYTSSRGGRRILSGQIPWSSCHPCRDTSENSVRWTGARRRAVGVRTARMIRQSGTDGMRRGRGWKIAQSQEVGRGRRRKMRGDTLRFGAHTEYIGL